jgi:hypothetical protein
MLQPSNQEMQIHFQQKAGTTLEATFIDFGNPTDIYGKDDIVSQGMHLDITGETGASYMHRPTEFPEPPLRQAKPFVDTGKTIEPGNPSSWTFPTRENYLGWMPGDPINLLTWATDSSLYIQEIMKQNFVVNADGKHLSIFDLDDKRFSEFKFQFGNAARHALGMGDLIFEKGMSPQDAETGMFLHEPPGWATA